MTKLAKAKYNQRLDLVTTDLFKAIRDVLLKHRVNHDEYGSAMLWIRDLVQAREVPMFRA